MAELCGRLTDMAELFSHMRTFPPNMADYGVMRSGTKANILVCASDLEEEEEERLFGKINVH